MRDIICSRKFTPCYWFYLLSLVDIYRLLFTEKFNLSSFCLQKDYFKRLLREEPRTCLLTGLLNPF